MQRLHSRRKSVAAIIGLGLLLLHAAAPADDDAVSSNPEQIAFFEQKIRPLLHEQCYECHSSQAKEIGGGLRLDSKSAVLRGGESGPALVPGDAAKSLMLTAVQQTDKDLRMPPEKKLSAEQIADLERWIKSGAVDPRLDSPASPAAPTRKYGIRLEDGLKFWSFKPVQEPPVPIVQDSSRLNTTIDQFIAAAMEANGVAMAPAADRRTLLRRASFDLTGLPPTPEEMSTFLADQSSQAFEMVVDRLLESPRYGQRWGRHWLDVVRYADTCGNASDYPVPQAYKYRDWVIDALNADLPYDEFIREQIAGDLMPSNSDAERFRRITATGYLAIARRFGGDRMGEHHLTLEDTIDNLGRAVLGSSIACARCHDHKFDPFTTSDYYGLYGIFDSTRFPFPGAEVGKRQVDFVPLQPAAEVEAIKQAQQQKIATLDVEVKRLEAAEAEANKLSEDAEKKATLEPIVKSLGAARAQRAQAQAEPLAIIMAYAVADAAGKNAQIHLRGDPKRLGDEVPRHFPAVLGGQQVGASAAASGRLELATWLTQPSNPLTARVIVNRVWQQHFGSGIVRTPNDFGRQGQAPTHPELLDHLAATFMEQGWSLKKLHKQILLSTTWQLSSIEITENAQRDPNNDLFWRQTRRRLDAESLRDALLFVSGTLDERVAAPHPFPPESTWGWTQHNPFFANYDTQYRSVYLMQQRLRKNAYLALFDGADPSSSTGQRLRSTTPLQALFLMNGALLHDSAAAFANRVVVPTLNEEAQLELAYQLAFNRSPDAEELQGCHDFLSRYRETVLKANGPVDQAAMQSWIALARVLLSSNEFAFVD